MHHRMFHTVPELYPVDASSSLPVVTTEDVSSPCQMWPGAGVGGVQKGCTKSPQLRNPGFDDRFQLEDLCCVDGRLL